MTAECRPPEGTPEEWMNVFMRTFYTVDAGFTDTVRACLAAVAPLIAEREREACAKFAEAFPARTHGSLATAPYAAAEQAAEEIAAAIRARKP